MQIPFVFCFLTLSITLLFSRALTISTTFTQGSDTPTLIALKSGLNNLTLGIPRPPETFDLSYEIGGPKLRITSCLMNTIAALRELALGDWYGKVIDGTEYRLDNYPEVSITLTTPRRKHNIQARFVIWAICLGVYEMISRKKFEFAQFEMSWYGKVLGWVQIVNQPAGESPNSGNESTNLRYTNGTIGLEPINITNVVTIDNANDPDEARLSVTFTPYGTTLSIYDVFVPIMSGLTDMAQLPITHQTSGLIIGLEGFEGFICLLAAMPARTGPPYMEYGWLIRAIARIPAYMLEKGRFGEINIVIAVDGVDVGFGRLATKPDCDPDALLSASL